MQPSASIQSLVSAFAPTGALRAAINLGNPLLARRLPGAEGAATGVSVDLAGALAQALGVALELLVVETAAGAVAAVAGGQADVGFFAIDPARGADIGFTAPYLLIEGAYLVREDAPFGVNGDVDSAGTRVVVGKGSAYDLYLSRQLQHAEIVRAPSSQAVLATFLASGADVAAGVRQQLEHDKAVYERGGYAGIEAGGADYAGTEIGGGDHGGEGKGGAQDASNRHARARLGAASRTSAQAASAEHGSAANTKATVADATLADAPHANAPQANAPHANARHASTAHGSTEHGSAEHGSAEHVAASHASEEPGQSESGKAEQVQGEQGKGKPGNGERVKGQQGKGEQGNAEPGKGEPGKGEPGKEEPGKGGHEQTERERAALQPRPQAAGAGGLRLLDGRFMVIEQAMGLPKSRGAEAAAYLRQFVEAVKADGTVAAALLRHGIDGAAVAPPA